MNTFTLQFSDAAVESAYLVHSFEQSDPLIIALGTMEAVGAALYGVAFPDALPAAIIITIMACCVLIVRVGCRLLSDRRRGAKLFSWILTGCAIVLCAVFAVVQRFLAVDQGSLWRADRISSGMYIALMCITVLPQFVMRLFVETLPRVLFIVAEFIMHLHAHVLVVDTPTVLGKPRESIIFVGAFLVTELFGYAIEKGWRSDFLAARAHGPVLCSVHRLTLRFSDEAHEQRFRERCFQSAYSSFLLIGAALMALNGVFAACFPETTVPCVVHTFFAVVALVGRIKLHHMPDQTNACMLFSSWYALWASFVALAFGAAQRHFPGGLVSGLGFSEMACVGALLLFGYLAPRLCGVPSAQRYIVVFAVQAMFALCDPPLSTLGHAHEMLLGAGAIMAAELIGHPIEFLRRHSYLQSERHSLQLADVRAKICEASEERLKSVVERSDVLMSHIEMRDDAVYMRYASPSYERWLGHAPASLLGDLSKQHGLFRKDELAKLISTLVDLLRLPTGQAEVPPWQHTWEQVMRHADGREIWYEFRAVSDDLYPSSAVVIAHNIADRHERFLKRFREAQQEQLFQEQLRLKDEQAMHFLAHELKNRFAAVRGLATIAHRSVLEHAPALLRGPHSKQQIFDDILLGLDRGTFLCMNRSLALQLAHDTYVPRTTSTELHAALRIASAQRATVDVSPEVPEFVLCDENLLLHCVENAVSNAALYGERDGHIQIRARNELDGLLRIEVTNEPGPKHAAALELYGESDAMQKILVTGQGLLNSSRSTGNGLRLSTKCANLLGGELSLIFRPNDVVTLLTLPLAIGAQHALPASLRVASLDDDDVVRTLDRETFARLGIEHHVRGATTSEICDFPGFVASLDPPPDVVLIDENLDDPQRGGSFKKGSSLVPELHALGYAGKVVIRSCNQTSANIETYQQCGADGALDKALTPTAFQRELGSILSMPPLSSSSSKKAFFASMRQNETIHESTTLAEATSSAEPGAPTQAGSEPVPLIDLLHGGFACSSSPAALLASFRANSTVSLNALRTAVAREDGSAAGWLHKLQGQAATFGALRLARTLAARKEPGAPAFGAEELATVEALHASTLTELDACAHEATRSKLPGPEPPSAPAARPPLCVAMDDDEFSRDLAQMLFDHLGADTSSAIFDSADAVSRAAFMALVLRADVVFLDQNMVDHRGEPLLGTDLARTLRESGCRGKLCIFTGSVNVEELRAVRDVDLVLAKGTKFETIAEAIKILGVAVGE